MAVFDFFLQRIPVMFGEHSGLTFAHVDDIAAGHFAALERGRPGEAYILCGPALTYRQVFEICEQSSGIRATRLWAPGWMAAGASKLLGAFERLGLKLPVSAESLAALADYTFWATAEKAKQELDWNPRPVDAVLGEVLDYEIRKRKR
jgi:nucleoside-diphosphate-sugar epimerase